MKVCKLYVAGLLILVGSQVRASGFGLYETSSKACAWGGAVVGRAVDASANFFNPATLSDLTNVTITAGFITEHPRARIKVAGESSCVLNPGLFWLPHVQMAAPLPWGFTVGLGVMPEYGLGSQYERGWLLRGNSVETTVLSLTVNPNLAWAITEDWSIAAGARLLYFDFEQISYPSVMGRAYRQRLKGDNGMEDAGWQIATRYRLTDTVSLGLVYKSKTDVHVSGTSRMGFAEAPTNGRAETKLELPQAVTGGVNWDVTPTVHVGGAITWTEWSALDTLDFKLSRVHKPIQLKWEDTWRVSLGAAWDFTPDWTVIGSYGFETDCCGDQLSTMLPAAERHLLNAGLVWRMTENLEWAFNYGIILMDGETTQSLDDAGHLHRYRAHRGLSHSAGLSLTYRF